ncbi:MAG: cyclic nucleotide-binding domain-containing protein [Gammaproteobacteria bacterium]|nr:cyclic nucleotide-binding domain-containing protein [Gammaproteobacteria bacterium]MBT8151459.1 cyclic nucleotide-binding domain-containing protein [Gammaproteobacteria bacterium]NND39101.1 cyclic nucleotide-binding domain-containing protein [Pseudomonadales bacterium]NNM10393.1 cyclic nucleotide-binding domain-containing protein [Pseudomonadales bacterium]RZV57328.1 MAG: cyclic nucleotide-binding domain-containing protein [Pseudomonadales bacterium]
MDTHCETAATKVDEHTDLYMFETGQQILSYGDDSQFACKLVSGTAKVIRSGDVVATIVAGQYFGAIAALTGNRRAASVVASERCVVEQISKHKFRLLIQTEPQILEQIC